MITFATAYLIVGGLAFLLLWAAIFASNRKSRRSQQTPELKRSHSRLQVPARKHS